MYSIVLMLAVSNNAAAPAWQKWDEISVAKRYGDSGHFQYRHRRGGSYGSYGCCGGGCHGGYYGGGCTGGHYGAGCTGGYYGSGCSGGSSYGRPISNGNGSAPQAMPKSDNGSYYGQEGEQAQANDRATIIVHLPAEAKLMIDDEATKSTSELRTFVSPALEQGKEFHYTLKAEINRDGKMVTKTKTITVSRGKKTEVDLNADESGKAAEPKAKSDQSAQPKANSGQPAQPKTNSDQSAPPKANSGQPTQPKANSGQPAPPKANSDQSAEPKP
jgi:uncharacterized protein (TIGR03000 family)